ncbi:MAG: fibronectin type III domain-containing protein [Bacteroidales bacterium]|nr:fibronectin type III domain-containing protein [Bacteroidales bacterium]
MRKKVCFFALMATLVALPSVVWAQVKPCDPVVNLPWWEDFQAYPHNTTPPTEPFCWHFQGTNEPSIGSYNINGGYLTCVLDLYSTGETWAVLQNPFDTTLTVNHLQVTFSAGKSRNDASLNSDLIIGICKNPSNPVGNFTPLDTVLAIPYCSPDTMARFTVDFSGYNDTGRYFCFLTKPLLSSGINFLAIDSLVFDFNDHCMTPQNFLVQFVSDVSASFSWGQYSSNHVELEYKRVSDTAWTTNSVVGRNHTINVFAPNTAYMARVRQDCSLASNGYSDWSDTLYFITDTVRCRMPEDLTSTEITNTTASFHWNSGGTATTWEVHVFNSTYDRTFTATDNTYTVTGLTHGTNYRVTVRSMCDATNTSEWTDTIMITTSQCYPVNNVAATPSVHEAVIEWGRGTSSTDEWEVHYGLPGFASGDELGIVRVSGDPRTTITGLDSATAYLAKVRTMCEDDRTSEFKSVTFTTLNGRQPDGVGDVDGMEVSVYPNPASTTTTIALKGVVGRVNVALLSIDGRTLQTFVKDCPADCETILDVEGLAQGAYLIRIYNDRVNLTRKFNIQ